MSMSRIAVLFLGSPWCHTTGGVTLSSSEAKFVAKSQAGQEFVYVRALLRGFGCPQAGATSIWEDNACIMMSETLTNPARSRHADVEVHFLRRSVCDGHIKLVKTAVTVHLVPWVLVNRGGELDCPHPHSTYITSVMSLYVDPFRVPT